MYALVCPNEEKTCWQQQIKGHRIAEIRSEPYGVPEPLYWIVCGPEVNVDFWCVIDKKLTELPPLPPMPTEQLIPNNAGGPRIVAI